ncbi:methylated-DNA--[protein]-cysteine S-methyltransferase [Thalassomonas sp. M1454]|uniref:methylated-DNA--[protein]-cysteine S-methyltransferase n=1 Tax=Thalassomonas sp. M1454 TaxID=2594477 RepID=UPI00117FC27C|nr:methylated-DNA--[protein]-cysteine S-methyltransferase [Thalassomonas sp. M1454]TRX55724.1 methylated-DNA--[protein]-cysteine S-methyltransferase [Thalassomonas sp. M1454]
MIYCHILTSQCGDVAILASDEGITEVAFQQGKVAVDVLTEYCRDEQQYPQHLHDAIEQLTQYFAGQRTQFNLPLSQTGTTFQMNVWHALTKIPSGKTISYGQLAKNINKPAAVRAVGSANGANKIAIIVPCHRVIGADKKLTGYAGGMGIKAKLLMLEGANFRV